MKVLLGISPAPGDGMPEGVVGGAYEEYVGDPPHETFFRGFELHGFYKYEDRVGFYHQVETFLAKYLAPKSASVPPAVAK